MDRNLALGRPHGQQKTRSSGIKRETELLQAQVVKWCSAEMQHRANEATALHLAVDDVAAVPAIPAACLWMDGGGRRWDLRHN